MLEEMWFALVYVRTVSDRDVVRVTPASFHHVGCWAQRLRLLFDLGILKAVHADGREKERPVTGFIPTVYIR